MKKLLFLLLFPILCFGQKAFQPKVNGWWYLQGITTKPTHNLIGVRDSNSTSDKAQIRLFGDVTIKNLAGVGYATFDANGKIGKSNLATDVQGIVNTNVVRSLKSFYTDIPNVGTANTDFAVYLIPAGTLANNGDVIQFRSDIRFNTTGSNAYVYFKGSSLYGFNSASVNTELFIVITRESSTKAKLTTRFGRDAATTTYFAIDTAMDWTISNQIKITGQGSTTSDIVYLNGSITFIPVQ